MATVKFYLNHPYIKGTTDLRKDEVSIDMMFTIDRLNRVRIPIGERIQPKYWDKKEKQVKASYRGHIEINSHLAQIKDTVLQIWRDNKSVGSEVLKGLVLQAVKGESQPDQKKTVIQAVQLFIAQYEREKETGTVKRYKGLLKKLTAFNSQISFEELDFNFYDGFKKFLYQCQNPIYRKYRLVFDAGSGCYVLRHDPNGNTGGSVVGLMDDVVFKYFVNLKTVCAWAEKRGYAPHRSYKEWEIIKREYQPISLTLDELNSLESLNLTGHLEVARDYLVLECRTGQRISDLKRFSKSDIVGDEWIFKQKKGARLHENQVVLPFIGYTLPALDILQKYNYDLPKISEQRLNEHIKTVCDKAGINQSMYIERWAGNRKVRIPGTKNEFISTHSGRKTFVTLCLQDPHFTESMVMDITGIRSYKTLKHYKGKSDMNNIRKALEAMGTGKPIMRKAQ